MPPTAAVSSRPGSSGSSSARTSAAAGPAGTAVAMRSTRKRRTPSATSQRASTYQWPSDAKRRLGVIVRSDVWSDEAE